MNETTETSLLPPSRRPLLVMLLVMAAGYFLLSDLMGGSLWQHQYWDSYTLQAYNWLQGRTYVPDPENYEYLELAVYNGQYYVSFPPVPAIPMVLWTLIWGDEVPGGLFQKIYAAIACLVVLSTLLRGKRARVGDCIAWAIFICFSSALLPITLVGAVWYEAQILAFLFSISAIAAIQSDRPTLACLLYALSIGCRPFTICMGPVLLMMYLCGDPRAALPAREGRPHAFRLGPIQMNLSVRHSQDSSELRRKLLRLLPGIFVGLCIAAAYAVYNYVRFDSVFEFGHNYLPEFTRAEHGQFSLHYIAKNWRTLFFGAPFSFEENTIVLYPFGFSMFISCPILICNLAWVVMDVVKRRFTQQKLLIVLMSALNVFLLLLHRKLGAHQFGLRYAIELIPLSFAYLLLSPERARISRWETALLSFGLVFNLIGGSLVHV